MPETNKTSGDGAMTQTAENRPLSLSERVRSLRLPERTSRPSAGKVWLPWTLCGILGVVAVALAIQNYAAPAPAEAGKEGTPGKPSASSPGATLAQPAGAKDDIALEVKGYIVPVHQIQVSPKVSGMVIELFIEEGQRVKEGDTLAKLEITEYKAEFDRALAVAKAAKHRWQELWKYREDEVRQAKTELDDAKTQRDQLHQEWLRNLNLKNSKAISATEYDQSESSYRSMEFKMKRLQLAYDLLVKGPRDERIGAAKAEGEQAEAELVKARWRLDNCTVVAPVTGTILTKKAEKGNMVNPAAFSNGLSASLCDMADLADMEVDLAVAERDISKVFAGQKCKVRAEAFPDRYYEAYVSRLMPIADRAKGAVPVRVKILIPREEEGRYLRPEMGALVTFFNKKD